MSLAEKLWILTTDKSVLLNKGSKLSDSLIVITANSPNPFKRKVSIPFQDI